jgi:large subunit ribosomal protein L10
MPTARKEAIVAELEDVASRSTVTISANYAGLSVAEMTVLRRQMHDAGIEVKVIKNTLFRMAAERSGTPALAQIVQGPTALFFGFDEPSAPARALNEYVRTARNSLTLTGIFLDGQAFPAAEVSALANLPSRGQLLAQFMGGLQSPVAMLAGLISGTLREFSGLIEARSKQLEAAET